ncbi:hypothetical protein Tco_0484869 [Tanacetum coccineum]
MHRTQYRDAAKADEQLAARLQTEEQEQFSIEQKSRMLVEMIAERKRFFAAQRAAEQRSKPPTKAQIRNRMCTYLKNMGGYKHNQLKGRSYEEIQKLFDKIYQQVNTFVPMDSDVVEGSKKAKADTEQESSTKRAGEELEQEKAKKQSIDEHVEEEKESEGLNQCFEIVPEDGDDVTIDATPLSTRSPNIVDYKIYKEGKKSFFQIIRADGNSQMYLTFVKMLKNFNREDLEVLWNIVKDRFKKTEPENYMDNYLLLTLKTMFEHHFEDSIWKKQQGLTKVNNWKLFDSCGMFNDVKLQVDYECEMAYELLRLVKRQLKEGYIVVEDVGEDEDFKDIENYLKNEKLKQVVAIIKSCTSNAIGDLIVTLKDLSSKIHRKVIDEEVMERTLLGFSIWHKDSVPGNGSGVGGSGMLMEEEEIVKLMEEEEMADLKLQVCWNVTHQEMADEEALNLALDEEVRQARVDQEWLKKCWKEAELDEEHER